MQRFDAACALAGRRVARELQACAAEAVLGLEDGLVGEGDFDGGEGGAVEAGGVAGEAQDLRPGEVVAFDVVGAEEGVVGVEVGGRRVEGDAAVEDDGAGDVGVRAGERAGCSEEDGEEDGRGKHVWMFVLEKKGCR